MKIIQIAILSSVCLFSACSNKENGSTSNKKEIGVNDAFMANIKTSKAIISNQKMEITLAGKVITDPDKTISYTSLVSGVIDRTYFSLGDKVTKGQVLMDVRSTELSSIQSELVSLESQDRIAKRELQSAQSMFDENMLSEKELLEAQGKLSETQASLNKIKSDIAVFGINKGNGLFSVKAPESGYIIDKKASSGSTLSTDGEPLFTIAELSTVWVIANIYASNLQSVKEGMDVEVTSISYPNMIFKGKVNAISQVFSPEDKALKARIVLPNIGLALKPEMSVVVKIKNETDTKLVSIPTDAVIFDDDKYSVIVQEPDNKLSIRKIIPQGHDGEITYVLSGLSEGENVVVKNQLLIYNQLKG